MSFPHLFSSGRIGGCSLKNRIIMALFPTKYATESKVNQKIIEFYRVRARGGAALIVLDCPCLDYPRAYKGPQELRLDLEEYAGGVTELINVIHVEGSKAFMQLNYPKERVVGEQIAGAKKKGDAWIVSLANAMSLDEADEILEIMAIGARTAREIGYDGVEIQASYGDLIAQLLSPLLNKRNDEMGGHIENRTRFLTRLIPRVKEIAGQDFPVMVKLVCNEFVPGGLGIDDAKEIARLVENAGADAIVANAGNKSTKFITIPPHYSLPGPLIDLASQIKASVGIPVVAIAKINSPDMGDEIIGQGKADFVAMARALIADPDFPRKAASGMVDDIRGCVYCLQDCAEKGVPGVGRCCAVNPFAGLEYSWKVSPAAKKKSVLVIGGGPSGIQAAIIASQRGHEVELWERSNHLGGQARLASLAPFKEEVSEALRYLKHCLEKSEVKVSLGYQAVVPEIIARAPEVVVVATGSRPGRLSIPGFDSDLVTDAREVYERGLVAGKKIVIIGGGDIGCETADWLAGPEREITVVEILPKVLTRMKKIPGELLLSRLSEKAVTIFTETRITSIEKNGARLTKKDGEEFMVEADKVIFAINAEPEDRLLQALKGKIKQVVAVGDAASPGHLGWALRSATEAALKI
jgi:2,4-dienoyl-CoA reductase-like NADH-dependent reductase (Old Yellow Enzyme family)/siroheme synthase (precorrin-2 oxidase/ferrochelatase)